MKLVVQRVSEASVSVDGKLISQIGKGFLVLVGIGLKDSQKEADFLSEKLAKLRIMADAQQKMQLSLADSKGEVLVVSQFTLLADTKGGNRPSFLAAARPEVAEPLYAYFVERLRELGVVVKTGQFGKDMKIAAKLDGPVTILL